MSTNAPNQYQHGYDEGIKEGRQQGATMAERLRLAEAVVTAYRRALPGLRLMVMDADTAEIDAALAALDAAKGAGDEITGR